MESLSVGIQGLIEQSALEWLAVLFSLAYLLLAMRQSIWCWPCAFISTGLYSWIFFDVSLVMESLLNIYYLCMAVYGFWLWQYRKPNSKQQRPITTWPLSRHAIALGSILLLTATSGFLLSKTTASWPYLDSFTTWASVVTTYMVAQKVYENWFYWLAIDGLSVFLYMDKGLYPTALLMVLYLLLAILGIYSWGNALKQQRLESTKLPSTTVPLNNTVN